MIKGAAVNRSEEEILDQTARIVAGTINAEKMGLSPEEVDVETFIQHFKAMLTRLFSIKDAIYLAIGPDVNADCSGTYSYDMQFILKGIQSKLFTEFYFYHGVALWLCKNELYALWLPN